MRSILWNYSIIMYEFYSSITKYADKVNYSMEFTHHVLKIQLYIVGWTTYRDGACCRSEHMDIVVGDDMSIPLRYTWSSTTIYAKTNLFFFSILRKIFVIGNNMYTVTICIDTNPYNYQMYMKHWPGSDPCISQVWIKLYIEISLDVFFLSFFFLQI